MPHDCKTFEQQDRMTAGARDPLMTFLQGNQGANVTISLRHQRKTDSQLLQILLTAARAWKQRGLEFDVVNLLPRLQEDCKLLGINTETTGWSGLRWL